MNVLYSEHITQFNILMIPKVVTFLKSLEKSEVIEKIIKLLEVQKDITCIISITEVDKDYEQTITDFKLKLKQFNEAAEKIFF